MASIAQVSQAMQTVLTTVADTAAHTTGFVQRVSKLTGARFTQTLVLGFLSNPQATREELAQTAATRGRTISQQGRDQRMTESGAACADDLDRRQRARAGARVRSGGAGSRWALWPIGYQRAGCAAGRPAAGAESAAWRRAAPGRDPTPTG